MRFLDALRGFRQVLGVLFSDFRVWGLRAWGFLLPAFSLRLWGAGPDRPFPKPTAPVLKGEWRREYRDYYIRDAIGELIMRDPLSHSPLFAPASLKEQAQSPKAWKPGSPAERILGTFAGLRVLWHYQY